MSELLFRLEDRWGSILNFSGLILTSNDSHDIALPFSAAYQKARRFKIKRYCGLKEYVSVCVT